MLTSNMQMQASCYCPPNIMYFVLKMPHTKHALLQEATSMLHCRLECLAMQTYGSTNQ